MFLPSLKSSPGEDIALLFRLDNHSPSYLCDCGETRELSVKDCQNIEAFFISHTHLDHFIGFDQVMRHQIGSGKRIFVCGPPGITEQVQAKLRGYQWNLAQPGAVVYEVREILDQKRVRRTALEAPGWEGQLLGETSASQLFHPERFATQYALLDHHIPSVAYRFQEADQVKIDLSHREFEGGPWVGALKAAFEQGREEAPIVVAGRSYAARELFHLLEVKPGDSLGVIMDHAASAANHQKIKALFTGCQQVFIESYYREADKDLAEQNAHSYSTASGQIMRACAVPRAVPVHFSRRYQEEELAELKTEFEAAYEA